MTKMTLDDYLESNDVITTEEKDQWKKNFVEGAFVPVSDNVMADVEQRNREEDKTLGKMYREISRIEKEFQEQIEAEAWPENSKARAPKTLAEKIGVRVVDILGGSLIRLLSRINRGLSNGQSRKGR